jgi:hypothetical protein
MAALLGLLLALGQAAAAQEPAATGLAALRKVPLLGLDGRATTLGALVPLAPEERPELLVLCFTEVGCPIASKYTPRLTRLAREYAERGVRFLAIDASPADTLEEMARDAQELERGFPVHKDHTQELTRRLGARSSTEVFVFDSDGGQRYRGGVDDQYALGAAKPAPTANYLVDALEALLSGREPPRARAEAPGCLITLLPREEFDPTPTWSGEVAAIVQRRCEACHRPGQPGPFPLQSFEDAHSRARMVATVVEQGLMPPWNADPRFDGVFANQRKLLPDEKAALLAWIAGGTPRGDPAQDPAPLRWPEGWTIGQPDVVFAMERWWESGEALPPEGFAVPREGVVEYQYFTAQTSFPEERWIAAIEARPGAPDVVHHVLVLVDDPAVPGVELDFRSYLGGAAPGDNGIVYPPGYAKRLPAEATLVFQMHYTPNGKERFDRSALGLVFCDEPPQFEVVTDAVVQERLRIPPGDPHHEVRAERILREDTGVLAFSPHMHKRGKDFAFVAHFPDGASQELLACRYDFDWQEFYLLPDPLLLPAGTRLECIGHFDNSSANPDNPDPAATVRWGDQSWEEMFIGYFDRVQPVDQ